MTNMFQISVKDLASVPEKLSWSSAVWYKTKFGSQILATKFGVFFMIYVFSNICLMWLYDLENPRSRSNDHDVAQLQV